MTHTVADAEAAIRRHPESLEELSRAADLFIEQGDPRGEAFAACLSGGLTAEELMRQFPADVSAMFVAAWALDACKWCRGAGLGSYEDGNYGGMIPETCSCRRGGRASARAEALRLLAACGKVGEEMVCEPTGGHFVAGGYWGPDAGRDTNSQGTTVAVFWYARMSANFETVNHLLFNRLVNRLALLDAYATADPGTRRRWAEETRALAAKGEVGA